MTTAVRCEWIKIIPTFCQQKSFWSAKINFLVYRWILVVCVPWGEKSWKSLLYIMLHEMLLQLPDTLHRETSQKTLLRIYPNKEWLRYSVLFRKDHKLGCRFPRKQEIFFNCHVRTLQTTKSSVAILKGLNRLIPEYMLSCDTTDDFKFYTS